MGRKVFISFLGTAKYLECIYVDTKTKEHSKVVRFVQEALCDYYCKNWTAKDKIYVCVTGSEEGSEVQNWEGKKYNDENAGLKMRLQNLNLQVPIETIKIPEGFSEKENEKIFLSIYNKLQEEDEIYLDITNAFRSIPMFAIALLDYTRFLKKGVSIASVFYGAFEALYDKDKKLIHVTQREKISPNERFAPIIHLTDMLKVQRWAAAANDFVHHGNTNKLADLAESQNLNNLATLLKELTGVFATVRGRDIVKADIFNRLNAALTVLEPHETSEPLKEILNRIKIEIRKFENQDILNGFKAVQWCYQHDLIQQGITLLQETIITFMCDKMAIDSSKHDKRKIVSSAFNCAIMPEEEWKGVDRIKHKIRQIHENNWFQQLEPSYNRLKSYRNDINHGGFSNNAYSFIYFKNNLKISLEEVNRVLNLTEQ